MNNTLIITSFKIIYFVGNLINFVQNHIAMVNLKGQLVSNVILLNHMDRNIQHL